MQLSLQSHSPHTCSSFRKDLLWDLIFPWLISLLFWLLVHMNSQMVHSLTILLKSMFPSPPLTLFYYLTLLERRNTYDGFKRSFVERLLLPTPSLERKPQEGKDYFCCWRFKRCILSTWHIVVAQCIFEWKQTNKQKKNNRAWRTVCSWQKPHSQKWRSWARGQR